MPNKQTNLISSSGIVRNVFWNLLGAGAPLLVAIISIPILIDGLGIERFGVLTLVWMVVGYFSLFDMGLGRALTKLVAEKLGKGQAFEIPSLIWTAITLMSALGILGAVIIVMITPWLVGSVLNISPELQPETVAAFYLLAVSIPIVIGSVGLSGVLEAHQRFGLVNSVRIPLGIFAFIGPLVVLPFTNSLVFVVAVLVFARLVSWVSYAVLCLRVEPDIRQTVRINRVLIRPLLGFGGWMTVTNIVGPLMLYMDRFLIGALVSVTAMAYYATPYEVVSKLWIIPGALMGVIFPAFATALVQDRVRATHLFKRTVNYIFILLFPVVLIIVTFASEGLTLWLGSKFSSNSSLVLQLLVVGVFINSHAHVPFGLVQAAGRPDLTAKLHLIELPLYLLVLWWLLSDYGIVGAAIAWVLRVAFDTMLLFVMSHRILPAVFTMRIAIAAGTAFITLALGAVLTGLVIKGLFLITILISYTAIAWFIILETDERGLIRDRLKAISVLNSHEKI